MNNNYEEINDDFEKLKKDILESVHDEDIDFKVGMLLDSMENNLSVIISILDDVKK